MLSGNSLCALTRAIDGVRTVVWTGYQVVSGVYFLFLWRLRRFPQYEHRSEREAGDEPSL